MARTCVVSGWQHIVHPDLRRLMRTEMTLQKIDINGGTFWCLMSHQPCHAASTHGRDPLASLPDGIAMRSWLDCRCKWHSCSHPTSKDGQAVFCKEHLALPRSSKISTKKSSCIDQKQIVADTWQWFGAQLKQGGWWSWFGDQGRSWAYGQSQSYTKRIAHWWSWRFVRLGSLHVTT